MSSRRGVIVVSPQEYNGIRYHNFDVDEAFGAVVDPEGKELKCKATDTEFKALGAQGAVLKAGEKLLANLKESRAVQDLFAVMSVGLNPVSAPGTYPSFPLFVRIEGDSPEPDGLPWETLWEKRRQFLCLDQFGRWPVARLVSGAHTQPVVRCIEPVLRIALVLAAAGEKGADEWKGFELAIAGLGVPVEVLVLVSEEEALRVVQDKLNAWPSAKGGGHVDYVGDQNSLLEQILAFSPNILHFFCHGSADTAPELEVETRIDRRGPPKAKASIRLNENQLAGVATMRGLWLIVLNCCKGAQATTSLHSLARGLVVAGAPAVVAMRESIDVADGNLFTQSFYASLLRELKEVYALLPTPGTPGQQISFPELLWMKATDNARRDLSAVPGRTPVTHSEWTYPVLYIYRFGLLLEPRSASLPGATLAQKVESAVPIELLSQVLESIRPGVDPATDKKRAEVGSAIVGLEKILEDQQHP